MLLFSLLLGFHGHIILRHVDDIYVLPAADGLQQAEEGRGSIPCKERVQAIKHYTSETVAQLQAERMRWLFQPESTLLYEEKAFSSVGFDIPTVLQNKQHESKV